MGRCAQGQTPPDACCSPCRTYSPPRERPYSISTRPQPKPPCLLRHGAEVAGAGEGGEDGVVERPVAGSAHAHVVTAEIDVLVLQGRGWEEAGGLGKQRVLCRRWVAMPSQAGSVRCAGGRTAETNRLDSSSQTCVSLFPGSTILMNRWWPSKKYRRPSPASICAQQGVAEKDAQRPSSGLQQGAQRQDRMWKGARSMCQPWLSAPASLPAAARWLL